MSAAPAGARTVGATWWLALLGASLATAAATALALRSLGARALPGCALDSPCARAIEGPWGTIPGLDWPVACAGAAYFAGLVSAWVLARGAWPSSLAWL